MKVWDAIECAYNGEYITHYEWAEHQQFIWDKTYGRWLYWDSNANQSEYDNFDAFCSNIELPIDGWQLQDDARSDWQPYFQPVAYVHEAFDGPRSYEGEKWHTKKDGNFFFGDGNHQVVEWNQIMAPPQ